MYIADAYTKWKITEYILNSLYYLYVSYNAMGKIHLFHEYLADYEEMAFYPFSHPEHLQRVVDI